MAELDIRLRNVVVSAALGHHLDLDGIAASMDNARYNPRRFPCVVVKVAEPKSTVLAFRSGKVVCVGAPSGELAASSLRMVLSKMRTRGVEVRGDPIPKVQNVVATADLHYRIRIDVASRTLPRTVYEPEMFPGVIHRMVDPRAVVLLFASGKVVCVGARSEEEACRAVRTIRSTLDEKELLRRDPRHG